MQTFTKEEKGGRHKVKQQNKILEAHSGFSDLYDYSVSLLHGILAALIFLILARIVYQKHGLQNWNSSSFI